MNFFSHNRDSLENGSSQLYGTPMLLHVLQHIEGCTVDLVGSWVREFGSTNFDTIRGIVVDAYEALSHYGRAIKGRRASLFESKGTSWSRADGRKLSLIHI